MQSASTIDEKFERLPPSLELVMTGPCRCGMQGKRFVTLEGDAGFLCPRCFLENVNRLTHSD